MWRDNNNDVQLFRFAACNTRQWPEVRFGSNAERLEPSISCPLCTRQRRRSGHPGSSAWCHNRKCQIRLASFASGRTTSRVHSMNKLVAGLSVRPFKVMNPTGQGGISRFTGKIFTDRKFLENRNIEPGRIARNGPPASNARCMLGDPVVTPFGGNSIPPARNA